MTLKKTFFHILFVLLFPINIFSQDTFNSKINFDFEALDDHIPKGWDNFGNDGYKLGIDSSVVWSGNNSAFIEFEKGKTGFHAWSFSIPANYIGKKIRLTGHIKTENITEGFAGLWMRIDPKVAFYNMRDRGITGTTEWQKYEIELKYDPSRAERILVGGLLGGNGKMWMDNLEVTIDGKKLEDSEKLGLTAEVKQSLQKQLKKNKKDLNLTSEELLDRSLQSLIESIGDKKIVAIGEDTHGTSEYYQLREAITKKLIINKGFNMVILENPYDDIELMVERFKSESLDTLMKKHLFSIYQTKEMLSFLEWYKMVGTKKNVELKGSDDSYWVIPNLIEEQLITFEDKKLKVLINNLKDAANLSVVQYNQKYLKSDRKAANENQLGVYTYEAALALEEYLVSHELLNKKMEEYLFNIKSTYINYLHLAHKKPIQSRDEMMAKRIAYFAKDPDSKIVVWAHNAHISNITVMNGEIGLMGCNLKRELGDDYHSIGMSSLKGNYSYIDSRLINNDHYFDDKLREEQLIYQPKKSWEKIFNEISNAFYFETIKFARIKDITNLKLVGYGKERLTDYYSLTPLKMFDTIFFINITSATKPLFD